MALAYDIDHEMSCPPEWSEFISAEVMEDIDEFKETQETVLYFCKKKQDVKKFSDEKTRQEMEMKITRIRNSRSLESLRTLNPHINHIQPMSKQQKTKTKERASSCIYLDKKSRYI